MPQREFEELCSFLSQIEPARKFLRPCKDPEPCSDALLSSKIAVLIRMKRYDFLPCSVESTFSVRIHFCPISGQLRRTMPSEYSSTSFFMTNSVCCGVKPRSRFAYSSSSGVTSCSTEGTGVAGSRALSFPHLIYMYEEEGKQREEERKPMLETRENCAAPLKLFRR
jgi:hypothetical protein